MTAAFNLDAARIAVVGLGYVGLPLAAALGGHFRVTGVDIDAKRIERLALGIDDTGELEGDELKALAAIRFTSRIEEAADCNIYIIAVPTPVDAAKLPDLSPLLAASRAVGAVLKRGDLVIYESTVYPGATEEVCVPELERASRLLFNTDFHCGYSPERINPGDRQRRIADIVKVTSGSTPEAAEFVDDLYRRIIRAGTHRAPSIRVAEAAKAVENTQRDINIAFANELAMMFGRMSIDTEAVLQAAETKWNFMPVRPGLVGGHCIGVDPYYLIHKAEAVGASPTLIRAAREINEGMSDYLTLRLVRALAERGIALPGARILVLGVTFKENCADLRNSRVIDVLRALQGMNADVSAHDPWADPDQLDQDIRALMLTQLPEEADFDAVLIAVAHQQFRVIGAQALRGLLKANGLLFDAKCVLTSVESDLRL